MRSWQPSRHEPNSRSRGIGGFRIVVDNWTAARAAKEQQRRDPYGFLAYAGFNKLTEAPARFAGIPGSWSTGPAARSRGSPTVRNYS